MTEMESYHRWIDKVVDQLNKLLAGLDKNSVITLKVRRGDSMAFVTVNGLTDKG